MIACLHVMLNFNLQIQSNIGIYVEYIAQIMLGAYIIYAVIDISKINNDSDSIVSSD